MSQDAECHMAPEERCVLAQNDKVQGPWQGGRFCSTRRNRRPKELKWLIRVSIRHSGLRCLSGCDMEQTRTRLIWSICAWRAVGSKVGKFTAIWGSCGQDEAVLGFSLAEDDDI
jgi:hypothetical protein